MEFEELRLGLKSVKDLTDVLQNMRRSTTIRVLGYVLCIAVIGILFIHYATKRLRVLYPKRDDLIVKAGDEIRSNNSQIRKLADGPMKSYPTYMTWSVKHETLTSLQTYQQDMRTLERTHGLSRELAEQMASSIKLASDTESMVESYNETFVRKRRIEYQTLFAKAAIPLDDAQQVSIITDDKHNFVIASAGSGKTEVLINRIAYLVSRTPDTINTNRILALAFQRNAAQEIEQRLQDRFDIRDVKVKTFHSLGLEILRTAGVRANLRFGTDKSYTEFIEALYRMAEKNPEFRSRIVDYMKHYEQSLRQKADFETREEYYHFMRNVSYSTLNGTRVKSEAEKAIMNFFLSHRLNGKDIKPLYEAPAQWMKYRNEKNQVIIPKPDFYLPDYDIYLEHWAIDAEGNVPEWFANPKAYRISMDKKRMAYKTRGKSLVETTSADYYDSSFMERLQKKVTEQLKDKFPLNEFAFSAIPYEELVEKAYYELRMAIRELPYQVSRFILIAKTYALDPSKIDEKLRDGKWTRQQVAFAKIALEIFREYESALKATNEIDFADMINLAVDALKSRGHRYRDTFDHILVDEYQDLSTQRYRLLKAILEKNPSCKLFAVGDDWQSIMGFAGSNLEFTLRFSEYFDHPAITNLTTNYRSAKSIVDLGAAVINHNKSRLPKKTVSKSIAQPPIMAYMSPADKYDWEGYYANMVDHCTSRMREYLDKGYEPSDMMILVRIARNPRLINALFESAERKGIKLSTSRRNPHAVPVISVHKSKGLQARAIFLLNTIDHMYGFPCTVEDLDLFAPATEGIPRPREEEERRLFYVAITRAKENLAVYSQSCRESKFIKEVKDLLREEILETQTLH